jgi:hypothetical protein
MTANCLLSGSIALEWYLGVVVLDVARGARVLVELMFNIMHVRTFVEKYIKEKWCGDCRKIVLLSVAD